jgi:hypothetical protein
MAKQAQFGDDFSTKKTEDIALGDIVWFVSRGNEEQPWFGAWYKIITILDWNGDGPSIRFEGTNPDSCRGRAFRDFERGAEVWYKQVKAN